MNKNSLYKEIERWLIKYKKNSVKYSSYNRFISALRLIGRYDISEMPPSDITTDDLQIFVNTLVADEYSKETIKKTYRLVTEYLDHCLCIGTIDRAVHKGVKLPKESSVLAKKRKIIAYDDSEQYRLCQALEDGDNICWKAAILMLETGMRIGEVMALDWRDIDWTKRSIWIHKTTVRCTPYDENYVQDDPKTPSSVREIPLSMKAQKLLKGLMKYGLDGFIFHYPNGDPLRYDCMKYWIKEACKEAGVKYHGLHVFRHTFATNCYYKGCDVKLLSKMLGHANISTTYNMYIHLYGDALEEMRKIVD